MYTYTNIIVTSSTDHAYYLLISVSCSMTAIKHLPFNCLT